jgi:predicted Zn-dependent protease
MTMIRGCEAGPFGRHRVVALSPDQELQLGAQAFREVLQKERSNVLSDQAAVSRIVQSIGHRLAKAAESPAFREAVGLKKSQRFEWDFKVVRSDQVNAFCLPGGKVVVYTGILPTCETESGLATVMGHEIAHALCRHGAERLGQQQLARAGQQAAAVGLGGMDSGQQQMLWAAISAGTQLGLLKYSRAHESEADRVGLLLMASAGYDPAEAPEFWTRMARNSRGGGATAEFMSTHPSHQTRVADLRDWYRDALPFYERAENKPNGRVRLPDPAGELLDSAGLRRSLSPTVPRDRAQPGWRR